MAHSYRKAFYTISKRMAENVHSVARSIVKRSLRRMDVDVPQDMDVLVITANTKYLGLEDWGTKLGLEFDCEEEWKGERDIAHRK